MELLDLVNYFQREIDLRDKLNTITQRSRYQKITKEFREEVTIKINKAFDDYNRENKYDNIIHTISFESYQINIDMEQIESPMHSSIIGGE